MDNEAMEEVQKRLILLESTIITLVERVNELERRVEELDGQVSANEPFTI